ncbi:MAG: dockerin type I repeat-containing protein [Prevotella sp.]|nr:dockerin type I repeat-containing protein [Prevotella sp.]
MKRKLLTFALMILVTLGLYAGSGDVNGDGKINVADIVELVNYLNGKPTNALNLAEADVNNDGIVNLADVDAIANIIMGVPPKLITPNEMQLTDSGDYQKIEIVIESDSEFFNDVSVSFLDNSSNWLSLTGKNALLSMGKLEAFILFQSLPMLRLIVVREKS